ncbi:hypothetical protein AVEN_191451-1 [Araneus ventricosus]|uniref:Uncharacterized protein n=1 Tax=Araneus ventricosus TaxID=182803 RepID=A0A4Y2GMU0_ARAVE|nr:hypothetical protein AVEN_191451-1 [Araneus ventricosus]
MLGRCYSLDGTGLNRSLQWCICLLETNVLPLRHLLNSLDGATTGPKQFFRPIGKAIKICEVAPFSSISVDNTSDNKDRMVLSNDQQYLYDICLAISRGDCYSDMTLRKPGPVSHSRWLTIAAEGRNFITVLDYYWSEKEAFLTMISIGMLTAALIDDVDVVLLQPAKPSVQVFRRILESSIPAQEW